MIRALYQGVLDVEDKSETIKAESANSPLIPDPCSLTPEFVSGGDELHEECGVIAIHGHPDAARQSYLGL